MNNERESEKEKAKKITTTRRRKRKIYRKTRVKIGITRTIRKGVNENETE